MRGKIQINNHMVEWEGDNIYINGLQGQLNWWLGLSPEDVEPMEDIDTIWWIRYQEYVFKMIETSLRRVKQCLKCSEEIVVEELQIKDPRAIFCRTCTDSTSAKEKDKLKWKARYHKLKNAKGKTRSKIEPYKGEVVIRE